MHDSKLAQSHLYRPVQSPLGQPWTPGFFHRLPWLGLGAIGGAVASLVTAAAILYVSNGQPQSQWTLQPTVYLAIASAITNLLLQYAFAEGVTISWWRQASKPQNTIGDLHRSWHYGNSLLAALLSAKHVNLVAFASILVAFSPVNGPLLQRASRVVIGHHLSDPDIDISIAREIPSDFTGILSGRDAIPSLLMPNFTAIAQDFNTGANINVSTSGCHGVCTAKIPGAGFAISCSQDTAPYELTPSATNEESSVPPSVMAFGSGFSWNNSMPNMLQINIQYKATPACDGDLHIRNCTFQAATVIYPVVVYGNSSTIKLEPGSTIFDDVVISVNNNETASSKGPSTYGGIYLALQNSLASEANVQFLADNEYSVKTSGSIANRYAVADNASVAADTCSIWFQDPTSDLLSSVRDLMFRTAVEAANPDTSASAQAAAAQTLILPIYSSHYLYLGLAVAINALAIFAVLPTFVGFWSLGRKVSMSPIETAKAFAGPKLRHGDPNADCEQLVHDAGQVQVTYGRSAGIKDHSASNLAGSNGFSNDVQPCLSFEDSSLASRPSAGDRFARI